MNKAELGKVRRAKTKAFPFLLFCIGVAFWPLFAILTIFDEKGGVTWLQTSHSRWWIPLAALALVSAVAAPLLADLPVVKKATAVVGAVVVYAASYGVVLLVGASFLGWSE